MIIKKHTYQRIIKKGKENINVEEESEEIKEEDKEEISAEGKGEILEEDKEEMTLKVEKAEMTII